MKTTTYIFEVSDVGGVGRFPEPLTPEFSALIRSALAEDFRQKKLAADTLRDSLPTCRNCQFAIRRQGFNQGYVCCSQKWSDKHHIFHKCMRKSAQEPCFAQRTSPAYLQYINSHIHYIDEAKDLDVDLTATFGRGLVPESAEQFESTPIYLSFYKPNY